MTMNARTAVTAEEASISGVSFRVADGSTTARKVAIVPIVAGSQRRAVNPRSASMKRPKTAQAVSVRMIAEKVPTRAGSGSATNSGALRPCTEVCARIAAREVEALGVCGSETGHGQEDHAEVQADVADDVDRLIRNERLPGDRRVVVEERHLPSRQLVEQRDDGERERPSQRA